MLDRTMPLVTFRCEKCGVEETVRSTLFRRRVDGRDVVQPHPHHHGEKMGIVQVQYTDPEV